MCSPGRVGRFWQPNGTLRGYALGGFQNRRARHRGFYLMETRGDLPVQQHGSNQEAREWLLSFENHRRGFTETGFIRNSKLIIAIGLIALVGLTGCAGKIGYPNYYVLNVPTRVAAATPSAPILGLVAVREFSAPVFLRAGPTAYRISPEQLQFYDYHRWAEDPRL